MAGGVALPCTEKEEAGAEAEGGGHDFAVAMGVFFGSGTAAPDEDDDEEESSVALVGGMGKMVVLGGAAALDTAAAVVVGVAACVERCGRQRIEKAIRSPSNRFFSVMVTTRCGGVEEKPVDNGGNGRDASTSDGIRPFSLSGAVVEGTGEVDLLDRRHSSSSSFFLPWSSHTVPVGGCQMVPRSCICRHAPHMATGEEKDDPATLRRCRHPTLATAESRPLFSGAYR